MTIQQLAGQLFDSLETRTRTNDGTFVCRKDDAPAWVENVIRTAHGDSFPDDTVYEFIKRCAGAIYDYGGEVEDGTEDDADDAIREIEPDCYTASLTAWLNKRADHVYYLTQALEECGDIKDGFQILAIAQQNQIAEIGYQLIKALKDELESREEDDNVDELIDESEEIADHANAIKHGN